MHYEKEEEPDRKKSLGNFSVFRMGPGAPEENLNEREINMKGKDFAEFFAFSFSHAASLTQEDLNWIEEISPSWR